METFRHRIQHSILDQDLQQALDANAERRVKGRASAFASIPDWRERRRQAHAIGSDVIERLPEYLSQFIHNAAGNGVAVHRATDADDAVRMILQIAESSSTEGAAPRQIDAPRAWTPKLLDQEPPETPALSLDTSVLDTNACVESLVTLLRQRGFVPESAPPAGRGAA